MSKLDSKKIQIGDLVAFTYYGKVVSVGHEQSAWSPGQTVIRVQADEKEIGHFDVRGNVLIEGGQSADYFAIEEKVNRSQLAEKLVSSVNVPLKVCFIKEDKNIRFLRGRLVRPEPLLGRSYIEDLDLKDEGRVRLVDHRTLQYLIVGGVKYVCK